MKSKNQYYLSTVLLIVLIISLFLFVGCDKGFYTKVTRAKELAQNIEKLPDSYYEIENGVNKDNVKTQACRSVPLYASSLDIAQSSNESLQIAEMPDAEHYFDYIDGSAAYYQYNGQDLYCVYSYCSNIINVIKYYKNIALDTVKQLSVWIEAPRQREKAFDDYMQKGKYGYINTKNYFMQRPSFKINYDADSDIVVLECKGNSFGGWELYIKAYCSYNDEGKIVVAASLQFFSGYGDREHSSDYYNVPQCTNCQIFYTEDDYMIIKRSEYSNFSYKGTLPREEFYKAFEATGIGTTTYEQYYLVNLATGEMLIVSPAFNQDVDSVGYKAEYYSKVNEFTLIATLYEIELNDVCAPKYEDDKGKFVPYRKRIEELFIIDGEKPLAVIDSKTAFIADGINQNQMTFVKECFNIQQFANVEICKSSSLVSAIEFVDSTLVEKNAVTTTFRELFAIVDETSIDYRKQSADNEIFSLLDFKIEGNAVLDITTGEIDLSNIQAIIPQSILFSEGCEYSVVVALKGTGTLVEIGCYPAIYNGQEITIELNDSVNFKEYAGMDDYALVAYIAKNSEKDKIRLSNFFPIKSGTSAQYKENWQEVVEENTRVKTLYYTYEIFVSEDGIMISKYYMISFAPQK